MFVTEGQHLGPRRVREHAGTSLRQGFGSGCIPSFRRHAISLFVAADFGEHTLACRPGQRGRADRVAVAARRELQPLNLLGDM